MALSPRRVWIFVAALALAVMAPALGGEFVWDDRTLLLDNRNVQDPARLGYALTHGFWDISTSRTSLGWNFYRPWVTLAYFTQFQLFGSAPWGYHLVSLVLHAACVVLGLRWIERRVRLGAASASPLALILAGVVLAVHPSRVETVAWISGCTDLWVAFWLFLASEALARSPATRPAWIACLPLALACFSKELAALAPALLLADAALGVTGDHDVRASWRRLWPLFATAALAVLVRVALVREHVASPLADGFARAVTRFGATLGLYLSRVAWPLPVTFLWGAREATSSRPVVTTTMALGLAAALAGVGFALAARRRPALRPWLADLLWFVVPLAPVLNVFPLRLTTLGAARYLYVPLFGLAALVARASTATPRHARAWAIAGAVALVAWSSLCVRYIAPLRSDATFWENELSVDPRSLEALTRLAERRFETGRHADVLALVARGYAAAKESADDRRAADFAMLGVRSCLATLPDADRASIERVRDYLDAVTTHEVAELDVPCLRLRTRLSPSARAALRADALAYRIPLAIARARSGDLDGAEQTLRSLVAAEPRLVPAWGNLAHVLAMKESWAEAARAAERGIWLKPQDQRLLRLRDVTTRAAQDTAAPRDETAATLRRARAFMDIGAPGRAREALAGVPDVTPQVVILRAQVEVADGQLEAARALLTRARERDPVHAAQWTDLLARLEAAAQARPRAR
jgi:tetratricopeptide (TPR) repeat protein